MLEDDQIFLHWQERFVAATGGSETYAQSCYLPTKADLFVNELHRWLVNYQVAPFADTPLPPRQEPKALLDRYHSHTQHCHSCRNALKTVEKLQSLCLAIALGGIALLPLLLLGLETHFLAGVLLSSLIAMGFAGWAGIGQFKRSFLQGKPIPPRNLPGA